MNLYSEPLEFPEAVEYMLTIAGRAELENEVYSKYEEISAWNPPFTLQEAFDNANEALEEFGL